MPQVKEARISKQPGNYNTCDVVTIVLIKLESQQESGRIEVIPEVRARSPTGHLGDAIPPLPG